MKRAALIAIPLVGMAVILGMAVVLFRTQTLGFRPRPKAAREALAITVDTVPGPAEEAVG